MTSVTELEQALNQAMLGGAFLDAFDQFYGDDVVMQENQGEPCRGKAANRERQGAFYSGVAQFHGVKLLGNAVAGDRSYSEWEFDFTFHGGARYTLAEVAVRRWEDGKVVHERFYWNQSGYPGAV
jgi:hypothetical protein